MKKVLSYFLILVLVFASLSLTACDNNESSEEGNVLRVYNWGEYIDEDLIQEFEEEYGVTVIYDTFSTNEEMYPKIEADSSVYDVICPSEYTMEKMLRNDLLQPINWDLLTYKDNIDPIHMQTISEFIDPGNQYFVPYTWGTVGILYNTTMVDDEVNSWSILFDEKYAGNILMQDSVRDAFMVAQEMLGYSINTKDEEELAASCALLQEQYPLVKAYGIDEVRDKMIAGNTALGVVYSGEYLFSIGENEDLAFAVPEEGTNLWYDGWVITKEARNSTAAHQWIDFLLRGDVAARNFDYITYGTPNQAAYEYIDEEILADEAVFPDEELIAKCEMYQYLGEEMEDLYYEYWKKVKW